MQFDATKVLYHFVQLHRPHRLDLMIAEEMYFSTQADAHRVQRIQRCIVTIIAGIP